MRAVEVTVRLTVPPKWAPGEDPEWFEELITNAFWEQGAIVETSIVDVEEV